MLLSKWFFLLGSCAMNWGAESDWSIHKSYEFNCDEFRKNPVQEVRLCTGGTIQIKKVNNQLIFSLGNGSVKVPWVSPLSKKVAEFIHYGRPNMLSVYYGSSWPEFQLMECADGIVLISDSKLKKLPNVRPDTFVYTSRTLPQLIVGRVEKSPFRQPSAALLDLSKPDGDIYPQYVFPKSQPIIVESFTATAGSGRVHMANCVPGTGSCWGDVPHLYPWISPDKKQHGWALALFQEWHLVGKERPSDKKRIKKDHTRACGKDGKWRIINTHRWETSDAIEDRSVAYDPLWYDNSGDIDNSLYLGKKSVDFPKLKDIGEDYKDRGLSYYRLLSAGRASWENYAGKNPNYRYHCACLGTIAPQTIARI